MNFKKLINLIIIIFINFSVVNSAEFVNECKRDCVTGVTPQKCIYDFYITENSKKKRTCNANDNCDYEVNGGLFINGKSPGPSIEICFGDTLEIIIHNKLKSQEVSFHWNGINQKSSAHMDGVTMITQCPILPYTSFRYDFKPLKNGTFFYHADSVLQQGDGLYGSLTVLGSEMDLTLDKILMISARTSSPLTSIDDSMSPEILAIILNGKEYEEIKVQQNEKYRFHLINANTLNCPILFSITNHGIKITHIDSDPVIPMIGKRLILFPGEKVDVEIETSQNTGKYLLFLRGLGNCEDLIHESTLIYENAGIDSEMIKITENHLNLGEILRGYNCNDETLCLMDGKSAEKREIDENIYDTHLIPFDVNFYDGINDKMTDYNFNFDEFTYYPPYLSINHKGAKIPQINGMTFKYPASPILSQPEAISDDILCSVDDKSRECDDRPLFCECLQILEVPPMESIEIILINEGKGGNTSHVFHIHGYSAAILGVKHFDNPISKSDVVAMNENGMLERKYLNPVSRDTFLVPSKGYIILHLFTDNLGYWLWESRSADVSSGVNSDAMKFLMRVGTRESLPTVPLDFPTCGNHRGPNLIIEDKWT